MGTSDVIVEKVADHTLVWINRLLAVDHDITIKRDRKVSIKGILILWVVSFIGMLFNFLTLIYIGVMLSLLVPPLYEKYQDEIDEKVGVSNRVLSRHIDTIITKTRQSAK
ncbi:Reticulon-like protein B10 [Zea mays]|uniref:Reticulon-like protein n=1 Tax=Zea mays TaxID=4577 RepID=A0A3L6FKB9_MAIZE|nr:Reticulon-like protein B10 [Zea mays]